MQAVNAADKSFMAHDPSPVIRRTSAAAVILLGAAALANRAGADMRPFLLMAVALTPQAISLALTLLHVDRRSWLKPDALTGWLLRGMAALALVPGLVEGQRLLAASALAAVALALAGWPTVLIAVKPSS